MIGMASSQVEIATSSPFGCVAVGRDSCFQDNLNNLVTSCIPTDNSHPIDLTDLWVHQPQWQSTTPIANTNCNNSNYDPPSVDYSPQDNNHKGKWARAREIVFPVDRRSVRSDSPKQAVEMSNLGGVSSLVQRWRGFEAEAEAKVNPNKSNSAATMLQDNAEPPAAAVTNDDDSIGDWESDRTTFSGPSSCRGRDSDFTESESLRVADIIRRLTEDRCSDVGADSPPRIRTSWDHQWEQQRGPLSPVICSPRIRGRQAYIDLLTQMERDRRKELEGLDGRKAVSQFSHRGRIQALFRIRFLRRGMGANEGRFSNTSSSKQSPATHIREKVNPNAQSGSCLKEPKNKAPAAANLMMKEDKYHLRICEECIPDSEASVTSKLQDICRTSPIANTDIQQNDDEVLHSYEHLQHEESPLSTFIRQETNCASSDDSLTKYEETAIKHDEEDKATNHQATESNNDFTSDFASPQSYHEEVSKQVVETDTYWVSDVSHPEVGWEEMHSVYQQREESNRDWIGEVSRPRSDWEDLRQARYQEMLDPFLDNDDIRLLLERKSVSAFLSSATREKIDQLMIFRSRGPQTLKNSQVQEEKHEKLPEQVPAVLVSGEGEDGDEEGEGYGEYFEEFEEAESSLGPQYTESDEYMDQPSSPAASWPQNQGHESSVCSYQVASTPTQHSPSNCCSQDNGPNSSYGSHPAIDTDLIYDLKRHMEQLHREMSELRKSIECCTDMQVKLQRSFKEEVAIALTNPETMNGRRNNPVKKGTTSGGMCSVCCEVQVDCVLYRCGHMCTCYECAHELQWSSEKCPVCRASIVDVVRTHSNY